MIIRQFLQKYILEVIPSIVATVVGAYIVTHYINRSDADKPAAAISAPASVKAGDTAPAPDNSAKKAQAEAAAKAAAEKQAAVEKAAAERAANERAEAARKAAAEKLAADKAAAEKREAERREKERVVAKAVPVSPSPEFNAAPGVTPDANVLARAAIDRLRGEQKPEQAKEQARTEPPRVPERPKPAPAAYTPPLLSSPEMQGISVPPSREAAIVPTTPAPPLVISPLPSSTVTDAPVANVQSSNRMVPPADIPDPAAEQPRAEDDSGHSVAGDVVSAAKSAFQSVLPH